MNAAESTWAEHFDELAIDSATWERRLAETISRSDPAPQPRLTLGDRYKAVERSALSADEWLTARHAAARAHVEAAVGRPLDALPEEQSRHLEWLLMWEGDTIEAFCSLIVDAREGRLA